MDKILGNYEIWQGVYLVSTSVLILGLVILVLLSFRLYRFLLAQDSLMESNVVSDFLDQTLEIFKRAILWALGYRGESREITPIIEVDSNWIFKYKISIFARLFPIYALYIMSLVIIARPVFFEDGVMQVFSYTKNLPELYGMFLIYVTANVVFDLLSLTFTLSHVIAAQKTKRYGFYLIKDAIVAFSFFILSQAISCVLWVVKREDSSIPSFDGGILSAYIDITFWPYAIVSDAAANNSLASLFPGQLLITGTVFFPTILAIFVCTVFYGFLRLSFAIKQFLYSQNLAYLCKLLLKVRLISVFNPEEKIIRFGWCNMAFLAMLDLVLAGLIGVGMSSLLTSGAA